MKNLKLIAPVMAFVFAFVAAFASANVSTLNHTVGFGQGFCAQGAKPLVEPPLGIVCHTTVKTIRCTVINNAGLQVPAYDNAANCMANGPVGQLWRQ